jgi:17beta-estradiol 17-dehydrogenase / very-long-chain 3-oxoacyl-CoA reductase
MLRVNNNGTIMMSRALLPHMMRRKSGAIITVSSASCTHPTPLLSCYSATKGFGNQLTRSMHYEYKEHGIDCLSIHPYYFVSNMFKRNKATYLAPFPNALIDAALPLLGYADEAYPCVRERASEASENERK